ncbi:MAG: hypothetical protein HY247_02695 [archaeon]|nr:MAG: hypothetical protein HY247_02695 [archaeon]
MPRRAAILRWTGRGSIEDLRSSVVSTLKDEKLDGRVRVVGQSIVVGGAEPVAVAALFRFTPGISWVAVGDSGSSFKVIVEAGRDLGRRYLKPGRGFVVKADATAGKLSSDLVGALTSALVEAVKGARVREESPEVVFRAAIDERGGAVGAEIAEGPGGSPTGREEATCLVSGGKHSSVVAWMALLAGYRVTLVHARVNESSMLAVSRLYSELSHRVAPRALRLSVLYSKSPSAALSGWARKNGGEVFGGFHHGCSDVPLALAATAKAPLWILPEESFESAFTGLSTVDQSARADWVEGTARWRERSYAGGRADVSDVLDGLD